MKLYDFLDVIGGDLVVRRYAAQRGRWCAQIDRSEIKDTASSGTLGSPHGNDTSPETAIAEYLPQIVGKVIVFDAMNPERRREFNVPESLEL